MYERLISPHLSSGPLAVAEGEGSPEGALDQLPAPPEHGVEGGVARDGVAEVLQGLDALLAIAWERMTKL